MISEVIALRYFSCFRSSDDFKFGLGSFSLLEEITMGQDWAKFLKPTISARQRPSEEPLSQLRIIPNPYDSGQSSMILNQQGGGNNQWNLKGSKLSPVSAQKSPDALLLTGMGVMEGEHNAMQDIHSWADQSEPVEHGHTQSNRQSEERRQARAPSFVEVRYHLIYYFSQKRHDDPPPQIYNNINIKYPYALP